MSRTRVLVVGADAAGMSAAHQALRTARDTGRDLDVVALERTRHTSYSACGIPYWLAGDVDGPDRLVARTADEHRRMGVDLRTGATATEIDRAAGKVTYRDQDGDTRKLPYDELVLATGAAPIVPDWARGADGALLPGVLPVKNLDDGARWLDLLADRPSGSARHAAVVGGGYIGVEMAETLLRRGWSTTLVTRSLVMSSFDPDMSTRIQEPIARAGVEVVTGTTVGGLETGADGAVSGVVGDDGAHYPADVVVLALGVAPATGLGADAGVELGSAGGYLPDPHGRVGEGLWAAGDCCETRHRLTGERVFVPLGTHANKQGRALGTTLAGGEASFAGVLGTAITRFAAGGQHVEIARTGLSTAEAEAAGIEVGSLVTVSDSASGYMPEAEPMATKVFADRRSRRLVGMEIVGGHDSGKRIDTAAAALWGGLAVDDVADMDLSYAPPFATVWEAVQLAARRLAERI